MSPLLNKQISQAACVVAVLSSFSATATTIAGFINMGTYHATNLVHCVGIWCGLLLFLCVFSGMLMMGTRHVDVAAVYLLSNFVSLALSIYGIIKSVEFYDDFKEFREYNEARKCSVVTTFCQCLGSGANAINFMDNDYTVEKCSLFAFGEDLWLAMIILVASCVFWSFVGFVIGLGAVFIEMVSEEENEDFKRQPNTGDYRPMTSKDMRIM